MSKKLTEKSLEKKLHNMGTEELIQIIMSLYRSNKSVEQSINLQIIGDAYGNELLEKYKKRIYKIFNPSDIVRMGFSIDTAQQVLAEFAAMLDSIRCATHRPEGKLFWGCRILNLRN